MLDSGNYKHLQKPKEFVSRRLCCKKGVGFPSGTRILLPIEISITYGNSTGNGNYVGQYLSCFSYYLDIF